MAWWMAVGNHAPVAGSQPEKRVEATVRLLRTGVQISPVPPFWLTEKDETDIHGKCRSYEGWKILEGSPPTLGATAMPLKSAERQGPRATWGFFVFGICEPSPLGCLASGMRCKSVSFQSMQAVAKAVAITSDPNGSIETECVRSGARLNA